MEGMKAIKKESKQSFGASNLDSSAASASSQRLDTYPFFDQTTYRDNEKLFQSTLPIFERIVRGQHLLDLPAIFFPHHVVSDEEKWSQFEQLRAVIPHKNSSIDQIFVEESKKEEFQSELETLIRRAVVSLQCDLALHAWGDAFLILNKMDYFTQQHEKIFGFVGENALVLSLQKEQIQLIQGICLLLMKDYQAVPEVLLPFLQTLVSPAVRGNLELLNVEDTSTSHLTSSETMVETTETPTSTSRKKKHTKKSKKKVTSNEPNKSTSGREEAQSGIQHEINVDLANLALLNLDLDLSGIQKKTGDSAEAPKRIKDDRYFVTTMNVIAMALQTNKVVSNSKGGYVSVAEITGALNPLAVLLTRLFFGLHVESLRIHRSIEMDLNREKSRGASKKDLLKMSAQLEKDVPLEVPRTCKLPMEYRCGPGGDRDLNHLVSTLSGLRPEQMKDVEVTVDLEKGGFKLVAKRAIMASEVFLIEKPFAYFGGVGRESECSHCLEHIFPSKKQLPQKKATGKGHGVIQMCGVQCGDCGERYCNENCRIAAYNEYHKYLCCMGSITDTGWETFDDSLMLDPLIDYTQALHHNACVLALKLLFTAESLNKSSVYELLPELKLLQRCTDCPDVNRTNTLPPELVEWQPGANIRPLFERFQFFCPDILTNVNVADFAILHSILLLNLRLMDIEDIDEEDIEDEEFISDGVSADVHLVASFANHDCDPNTVFKKFDCGNPLIAKFKKLPTHAIQFEAKRIIPEGDEITIDYLSQHSSYSEGSDLLETCYGMKCKCRTCEWDKLRKEESFCKLK